MYTAICVHVWGVISVIISYFVIGRMLCNRESTLLVERVYFVSNSTYISRNRGYTLVYLTIGGIPCNRGYTL